MAWLAKAVRRLRRLPRSRLTGVSPVYSSAPVGFADQRSFLNGAARIDTRLRAGELLAGLRAIEKQLGRRRTYRFGPRNIDLDILLYGGAVLTGESLTVPHPRLHERAFALAPCAALDACVRHPVIGAKFTELLAEAGGKTARLSPAAQRRFKLLASGS